MFFTIFFWGVLAHGRARVRISGYPDTLLHPHPKILYGNFFNKTIEIWDFIKYFDEPLVKMEPREIRNLLFIMDNETFHISKSVKKYKNVPYLSIFNSIKIIFKAFKNKAYKELYTNMKKLKNNIKNLIEDKRMNQTIKKLY